MEWGFVEEGPCRLPKVHVDGLCDMVLIPPDDQPPAEPWQRYGTVGASISSGTSPYSRLRSVQGFRHITSWVLCSLLFLQAFSAMGQGVIPSKGKEFWLGYMRNWGMLTTSGSLDVFISGDVATSGTVSVPAAGLSWPFTVVPGTTTTITVPMNAALHAASEIVENKGVLVLAQDTVSVFAINYEPQTADGTVVYPVEALGVEHRIFSFTGINTGPNAGGEFLIVATKDGTEVEITTTAMTLTGHAAGVPWVIALDSGQTYQVRAVSPSVDLTGSTIRGTAASGVCRPFAVFSGSACSEVPTGCWACDHLFEQQLPVKTWGTRYHAPPFASTTAFAYRVMAHEDGTQVSVNGAAPITLNAGQWLQDLNATVGACFLGDKPFAVAQYMRGLYCSGAGDPSLLQLNAQEQVIDRITFSTVVSSYITQHHVNVVLATADIPLLTLDGAAVPAASFVPFPACPDRSYAQLSLTPGSHTLACTNGFSAYVYGTGQEESYAYSVGSFTPVPPPQIFQVVCGTDVDGMVVLSMPYAINAPVWTLLDAPEDTLHWGGVYTFAPTTSALYVLSGTEHVSGCPVRFVFSVELEEPPTLEVTAGASGVCASTAVPLQVLVEPEGAYTVTWSPAMLLDDPSSTTPIAWPATDTWFKVEVRTLSGCAVSVDSVLVAAAVGDLLDLVIRPADTTVCLGAAVPLALRARERVFHDTFEGGAWSTGWSQVQGAGTSTACGQMTGDALYFNGGIQRRATTVDLDVAAGGVVRFALLIGSGTAPCEDADPGDDVVLEYSVDGGASWMQMATYAEWAFPSFTAVEVAIPPAGASSTTRFRWRQIGTWLAGQDNWALDDVTIARNGAMPVDVQWSPTQGLDDAGSLVPIARPTGSTWYTVTATDPSGLCTQMATAHIVVTPSFDITVTNDTTVCTANGLPLQVLHSVQGAAVEWMPAEALLDATASSTEVSLDSSRTFVVRVTAPDGCVVIDSVRVVVVFSDLPVPLDTTVCAGAEVELDPGQGGAQHQWSTGSTTTSIMVSTTGTYSVQLVDPMGCMAAWQAEVLVEDAPVVQLGADTAFCAGEQLLLGPLVSGDYQWNDGSTGASLTILGSGTYWVRVVNAAGCVGADTIGITMHDPPLVPLTDTAACNGDLLVLDAGPDGVHYAWTNGSVGPFVTVDGAVDHIGVEVVDAQGCITQAVAHITWWSYPEPELGHDTVLCAASSLVLDPGTPDAAHVWSTGAGSPTIVATAGGTYIVQASNGPCAVVDSINVDVVAPPAPVLPEEVVFCPEEAPHEVLLVGGPPGLLYEWVGPSGQVIGEGPSIAVGRGGAYTLNITDGHGCMMVDEVLVVSICAGSLYVPNTFTPDGDGHNDVFRPMGRNIEALEMFVFDRWGELLSYTTGPDAAWDGTYGGEYCQDGLYAWRIRYRTVLPGALRPTWTDRFGHVTLLR